MTSLQTGVLERLVARNFRLVAFPLYASAIGVCRDGWAALLVPVQGAGLRILGQPCYLIEGNLSVQVQRAGGRYFVWKAKSVEATPTLLGELGQFSGDLQDALSTAPSDA